MLQVFKLLFSFASALHLFSCAFWRIKKETFSEVGLQHSIKIEILERI